jgi:hypothetical protein
MPVPSPAADVYVSHSPLSPSLPLSVPFLTPSSPFSLPTFLPHTCPPPPPTFPLRLPAFLPSLSLSAPASTSASPIYNWHLTCIPPPPAGPAQARELKSVQLDAYGRFIKVRTRGAWCGGFSGHHSYTRERESLHSYTREPVGLIAVSASTLSFSPLPSHPLRLSGLSPSLVSLSHTTLSLSIPPPSLSLSFSRLPSPLASSNLSRCPPAVSPSSSIYSFTRTWP